MPGSYAIMRCGPASEMELRPPETNEVLVSLTRSPDETSVVCPEGMVPADAVANRGWRLLRVKGLLELTLTGVLASIAVPLADAEVPIFVVSAFATDYILVPAVKLESACVALRAAGHRIG